MLLASETLSGLNNEICMYIVRETSLSGTGMVLHNVGGVKC